MSETKSTPGLLDNVPHGIKWTVQEHHNRIVVHHGPSIYNTELIEVLISLAVGHKTALAIANLIASAPDQAATIERQGKEIKVLWEKIEMRDSLLKDLMESRK